MKFKTVTLIGLIGAFVSCILSFVYLLFDLGVFNYDNLSDGMSAFLQFLSLSSSITLLVFFYSLYKKQK